MPFLTIRRFSLTSSGFRHELQRHGPRIHAPRAAGQIPSGAPHLPEGIRQPHAVARHLRRPHSGHGGPAARHGLRHRLRRAARIGPLHRHHRWLPHLASRRLPRPDRRSRRRLRRHHLRHHRTVRLEQPHARHARLRRHPLPDGPLQDRRLHQVHPRIDRDRLHERHCGHDRPAAGQGLPRPHRRQDARRLLRPGQHDHQQHRHDQSVGLRPCACELPHRQVLAQGLSDERPAVEALARPPARHRRRPRALHDHRHGLRPSRRNDRLQVRRHSAVPPEPADPRPRVGHRQAASRPDDHDRRARFH